MDAVLTLPWVPEEDIVCDNTQSSAFDSIGEEENYSTWLQHGESYLPSVDVKACKKLPSGVYRVILVQDQYQIVPIKTDTDKLYEFSEDFSSIILSEIQKFWDRADIYKKYHFMHKRGLLLAGRPGTGKTACINLLIKQLVNTQKGLVFVINTLRDFNVYTDFIKPMLRKIEPDRPVITIIEDVDQLVEALGRDAELLDLLDGKTSIENHLIIFTSNNTSCLSPALLRPSRIDLFYEIPVPSENIRREFFTYKGVDGSQIDEFVKETDNMTFAELKEVFTGTYILGKDLQTVVAQVRHPFDTKDYLTTDNKIGI